MGDDEIKEVYVIMIVVTRSDSSKQTNIQTIISAVTAVTIDNSVRVHNAE